MTQQRPLKSVSRFYGRSYADLDRARLERDNKQLNAALDLIATTARKALISSFLATPLKPSKKKKK